MATFVSIAIQKAKLKKLTNLLGLGMISHKIPTWAKVAALIGIIAIASAGAHYYLNILFPRREEERLKKTDSDGDGISDWDEIHVYKTDPKKPDPVFKYAIDKGISIDIAKKLIPLDEDGRMDENEKSLVDYLYNLPLLELQAKVVDTILADGKVSSDEAKALSYLSTYSGGINSDYINFGLDGDVIKYLLFISSLKNQDFAKYAIENKLCIQDHRLTDLEVKFLNDPEKYGKDLLNSYIAELGIYPDLGKELMKIPEIKAAFNKSDVKTIESVEDIVYSILMSKNPELVRKNLDMMLKEGIPEKRKYCTPLQALEWHYVDNEPEKDNPLENQYFDLIGFITSVWRHTSTSKDFKSDKWKNFDEVVDRLNSPDLVSLLMRSQITYGGTAESATNQYWWKTPEETFKDKHGYCYDQSAFALHCLARNGYSSAKILFVRMGELGGDSGKGHAVCVYEEGGKTYTIDNGRIRGPFSAFDEVIMSASSGRKVFAYKFFYYGSIPYHRPYWQIYNSIV
jgi:hypothetical protein